MIGTFVDFEFFLLGSSDFVTWLLNLVNIYALAGMLTVAMIENSDVN